MGDLQLLTDSLVQSLIAKAKASPRLRANHNFHSGPEDNPHRFLNVLTYGTYIAPHRHKVPPKAESFIVLEGYVAFFIFNDAGAIEKTLILGSGPLPEKLPANATTPPARGIDVAPGAWHTLAAITPHAVCYEVKPGPWDPATDKEFAPWAPQEGTPGASNYLHKLLDSIEPGT
jgi:cupin fold WbuC family metalloprotein